jgi:GAF domain-containing protein
VYQLLSEAERRLSPARCTPDALQDIARAAVPRFADFCLIFLARRNAIRCVASAHCTGEGERLLRWLTREYRLERDDPISTVAHVVRSGRARLCQRINLEPDARSSGRVIALHRSLGPRSVLVTPIVAAPAAVGAISFAYADSDRRYHARDVAVARRLATRIESFLKQRTGRIRLRAR